MNLRYYLLFIILTLLIQFACIKNDVEQLSFFEVEIEKKKWTENYGTIQLNAVLSDQYSLTLDNHGFIWSTILSEIESPNLVTAQTIALGEKRNDNPFSTQFTLENPDEIYYFRAFAQKEERLVFSKNTEVIALNYSLQIQSSEVFNNEIRIESTLAGIENSGKFEEFGYVYSKINQEPTFETDLIFSKDSIKIDLPLFRDTLFNLDFNTDYFIRLFGRNGEELFYSEVNQIRIKDGWLKKQDIGKKTVGAFGVASESKGYVGFGSIKNNNLHSNICKEIFVFDPSENNGTWNSITPVIEGFQLDLLSTNTSAFIINQNLFAGSGIGHSAQLQTYQPTRIYRYDLLIDNGWIENATDVLSERASAVSFVLNGKGYVGGGLKIDPFTLEKIYLNDFYEYDPSRPFGEKWNQVDSLPMIRGIEEDTLFSAGREGAMAFSDGNRAYVGLGRNQAIFSPDIWEFDPDRSPQWKFNSFFPGKPRSESVSFNIDNRFFCGTGFNPSVGELNDFWEFVPATNEWIERVSFLGGKRANAFGFGIESNGYLGGGTGKELDSSGNIFSNVNYYDFWQYVPLKN